MDYDHAGTAAMVRIRTVFAEKGHDAERHRGLCRRFGTKRYIHKRGRPRGSGLGKRRWPVERSNAWVLENRRIAPPYDRPGFVVQPLLQAACIIPDRRPRRAAILKTASYLVTATASTSRRMSGLDNCAARTVLLSGEGGPK